jgi:hypothetical protein
MGGADTTPPPASNDGPTTSGAFPADNDPDSVFAGEGATEPDVGRDDSTCFDGLDNDGSGVFDCDDPGCQALASCRIGNGNLCTNLGDAALPILSCDDSPVSASCLGGVAEPFGSPSPWVAGGALHPGGTSRDSGILFADAVALRSHRLELRATFAEPACPSGDPCMDTVSIGVTDQRVVDLDGGARVRPQVALSYSGARREVTLLLSGTVADRWTFDPLAPDWDLVLRPDGVVDVQNGGASKLTAPLPYTPVDDAHVIVFGRSQNRAYPSPNGASITSLEIGRAVCDIPTAWEERGAVSLSLNVGGSPFTTRSPREVSTVIGGQDARRYLVFRDDSPAGQEQFMATFESTPTSYRLVHDIDAPILVPDARFDIGGIEDPELFWDPAAGTSGEWHLYYTAIDAEGVRGIGRATGPTLQTLTKDSGLLIDPALYSDVAGFEMPSHARSADEVDILLVRANLEGGGHQLISFVRLDDVWARVIGSQLDGLTLRGNAPTGSHFDADEVAHPSIVRVGRAYHIYYAGRRGTRWGIGLLATDDLTFVRDVTSEGPLLSGDGSTFDALSVLEPDVLVEDNQVSLFYIGSDGAARGLGRAARQTGSGE